MLFAAQLPGVSESHCQIEKKVMNVDKSMETRRLRRSARETGMRTRNTNEAVTTARESEAGTFPMNHTVCCCLLPALLTPKVVLEEGIIPKIFSLK